MYFKLRIKETKTTYLRFASARFYFTKFIQRPGCNGKLSIIVLSIRIETEIRFCHSDLLDHATCQFDAIRHSIHLKFSFPKMCEAEIASEFGITEYFRLCKKTFWGREMSLLHTTTYWFTMKTVLKNNYCMDITRHGCLTLCNVSSFDKIYPPFLIRCCIFAISFVLTNTIA